MTEAAPQKHDLDRLHRRFLGLQLRFAGLQGQARELQAQHARLSKSIALAKARIELAPLASEAFTYLQDKAHRRAVGEFEDLLSALVDDVIPDSGKVHLELGTERGSPSLDIMMDNGGDLENIFEGNGGGLTNVVVVGLGFSALSRTNNRKLMVLDEPDCWLKAVNVPAFTKVIAEVANPQEHADGHRTPGCQTLMISHNDIALMDDGAHIQELRIERDLSTFAAKLGVEVVAVGEPGPCAYVVWAEGPSGKGRIEVRYRDDGLGDDERNALTKGYPYLESLGGARHWASSDEDGVRWVEVCNLRSHVFTRMDLSSGLNVLTGGVNGGKSQLYFTALRAMAYGDSDDSMIRHGASELKIRLGLENDVVLELVRKRRGSPKVLFRRYERGVLVNEGAQEKKGTGVPGFITETLGINKVDDLDIQLRHQKEPVFLLNEPAPRRAKLLSVGRESGLLQELMARQRRQLSEDRASVKREEVEFNEISRTLTVLAPLGGLAALVRIMEGLHEDSLATGARVCRAQDLIARLAPLEGRAKLLSLVAPKLKLSPRAPLLTNVQQLEGVARRLAENSLAAQLPNLPRVPHAPALARTEELTEVLVRLSRTRLPAQVPNLPSAPVPPALLDSAQLRRLSDKLSGGAGVAALIAQMPCAPSVPALRDTAALIAAGQKIAASASVAAEAEKGSQAAAVAAKAAADEFHAYQHELGVCPVCAKPFEDQSREI